VIQDKRERERESVESGEWREEKEGEMTKVSNSNKQQKRRRNVGKRERRGEQTNKQTNNNLQERMSQWYT
jgi:hypothetical protein